MAKVNAPLLSLDAHGNLGKAIVFVSNRSGNVVRRYIKPRQNINLEMMLQRLYMAIGPIFWKNNFTGSDIPDPTAYKAMYNEVAKGQPVTGLNMWMHDIFLKNRPLVGSTEDIHIPAFPGDNTPWQT